MRMPSRRALAVSTCAAVLGIFVGTGVVAYANDDKLPQTTPAPSTPNPVKMADGRSADSVTEVWPKNEYGLTVGEPTFADRDSMNLPDLTPMTASNGKEGFVYVNELIYPFPKTAEEAAAQTKKRLNEKGEDRRTVFGPDGKTVLGTVLISTVTDTN